MNETMNPSCEPDGILLVDKPAGMTSHDVVFRTRRLFGTKKVGHTGTLDPMATGVLVLLIGRSAKAAEYVAHDEKAYTATLRLGLTTDTEDTTGRTLSVADEGMLPSPAAVEAVLPRFRGVIEQIPPMYSALKVGGRKLCDLARAGETVERQARPVEIRALTAVPMTEQDGETAAVSTAAVSTAYYQLEVRCSGGTYIRTLCADIGGALGCGGVMASLRRTEASGFSIDQCATLDELEAMDMGARLGRLLPVEGLFADCPAVALPSFFYTLCRNGCEIYQRKLETELSLGTRVRLCDPEGRFFALGEVREYEGGTAIKMIKVFVL